jgi:hypothetical protein
MMRRYIKMNREDVVSYALPNVVGIELGIAEGEFSERVLNKYSVKHWYGVDAWSGSRNHDTAEYIKTLRRLEKYRDRNTLLRMNFSEALLLFPNNYFDIIYVDGYAHTGQEQGRTLDEWYPKLKSGGIFSGDDYSPSRWPLNVNMVETFALRNHLEVNVIECGEKDNTWSVEPTWWVRKP